MNKHRRYKRDTGIPKNRMSKVVQIGKWDAPYEIKKIKFRFNQSDNDPNPSVPHGDNAKFKLNTVTGEITYKKNNKVYKKIDEKVLDKIYAEKGFQRVAIKSAIFYKEHFSWVNINSPLDKMKKKGFINKGLDEIVQKHSGKNQKSVCNARSSRKIKDEEFCIVILLEER